MSERQLYVIESGPCPDCGGAAGHTAVYCEKCEGTGTFEKRVPLGQALGIVISQHPLMEQLTKRICE